MPGHCQQLCSQRFWIAGVLPNAIANSDLGSKDSAIAPHNA